MIPLPSYHLKFSLFHCVLRKRPARPVAVTGVDRWCSCWKIALRAIHDELEKYRSPCALIQFPESNDPFISQTIYSRLYLVSNVPRERPQFFLRPFNRQIGEDTCSCPFYFFYRLRSSCYVLVST